MSEIAHSSVLEPDVCIVGAGAAGISLARELRHTSLKVLLLESGGLEFDEALQGLNSGKNVGRDYYPLERARARIFGGTTSIWGGLCIPLEEIDFEARSGIPNSGWPFQRSELIPYYLRAQSVLELETQSLADFVPRKEDPFLPLSKERVLTGVFHGSQTRFGVRYRQDLKEATNVQVLLHCNLLNIECTPGGRLVTRLQVGSLSGKRFFVKPRAVVLAAGGLENPRLLLASQDPCSAGLGNGRDQVGRYFMEHLAVWSGLSLILDRRVIALRAGQRAPFLMLTQELKRKENLLNVNSVFLHPDAPTLYRPARLPEDDVWRNLRGALPGVEDPRLRGDPTDEGNEEWPRNFVLWSNVEQAPNPESRVRLSGERDALGQRRIQLDWRLSGLEERTLRRTQQIIAHELGARGVGRLRVTVGEGDEGWRIARGCYHHMGTTRMHANPKQGVVDAQCRVHGTHNLYIAGSSVFPTVGYANPTFTIVALALRLADHLRKDLA